MKKFYLLLLLFTSFFASAQVINKAEYFIDTDPGQGSGINIAVGTSATTVNFTATVATNGLTQGFHNLNIRTRLDNGIWSIGENRVFYLSDFAAEATNVKAAEFFIDTDPGNGNATAIAIGASASPKSFVTTVPTTGLTAGFHNLIVRVQNELGQWGIGENRVFYIATSAEAANITAAEFFIDTDPGTGSATALSVGASGATTNFIASIPTTGLANGFHNLNIRTKNSQGIWGHYENRVFYVSNQGLPAADITAMEYFIDTDPGLGLGLPVNVATSGGIVTLVASIPTAGLTAGAHFLFLRAKSADGWGPFERQPFTIGDAIAPAKPVIASIDNKSTTTVSTNQPKPIIKGTAEAATTIEIFSGATSLGTVVTDASGSWTFTPPTNLANGTSNITATAKNASNLVSVASDAKILIVDTQVPAVPIIASVDGKTTQNFTTTNTKPIIVGTAEAGSTVELFNGSTSLGTVTANATGNYTFTPALGLPNGDYAVTAKATDAVGNISIASIVFSFKIDSAVPNAPVITSVDGKTNQNFITTNNKPIIIGTSENSSIVELFNGATSLGVVNATATGGFTFTPATALADGNYTLTAKAKKTTGSVSAASASFLFSIDTQAPSAPIIVGIDGKTTLNFLTANPKPTIVGTAEAGSTVEIFNGTTSLGTVTANASGNYTFTPALVLPNGDYAITTKAKDAVGNISIASIVFSFKIDSALPNAPVITSVDGKTSQNFTTTNNKPTIIGTADANLSVEVFNGATSLGIVNASATGGFTITPATALADGNYTLTAKAKKTTGSESGPSNSFAFIVDTKAPAAPIVVSIDGKTANPGSGNNNKPTLVGTAEALNTITIFNDNIVLGTVTASQTGNWEFTPSAELPLANYNFTVTAKDAIGNETAKSAVFVYNLIPLSTVITANNILTPNGDSFNDYLKINNLQYYAKSIIKIYDRAGRMVFTADAYKNDWAGDLNGTFLAEATYYYVVDLGPNSNPFKSFITVIRNSN